MEQVVDKATAATPPAAAAAAAEGDSSKLSPAVAAAIKATVDDELSSKRQTAIQTPVIQSSGAAGAVPRPKPESKNGKELQAAAAAAAASSEMDDDDEDDVATSATPAKGSAKGGDGKGEGSAGAAAKGGSETDSGDAVPPSKRFKKGESEEASNTSEEGVEVAGTSKGVPATRRLRKFQRIPIFIVDYHNDVLEFIYRCLATRHLPLNNNVLVHFDSHPDMVISREIPASASFDKETMLAELAIENWIMPTVFAGHVNRVVWLKNPWCQQIPTGKYRFKVGQKDDKINVDIPLDYFISEGNYCDTAELQDARDVELHVINADGVADIGVESMLTEEDASNFILDIDLDFFSTSNPFLEIYKDAQCYRRLTEIFRYETVGAAPNKADSDSKPSVEVKNGAGESKNGSGESKDGAGKSKDGAGESKDGTGESKDGAGKSKDDAGESKTGNGESKDAAAKSKDGAEKSKEGTGESKEDAGGSKEVTGESKDSAGKSKDGAGKSKDGAGESKDSAGKSKDGAGESKDGAGESKDSAGKSKDGAGESKDGAVKEESKTDAKAAPPTLKAGDFITSPDGFVINAGLNSQVYSGNTKRRKQQLEALKRIFEHLEEVRSFEGLPEVDPEVVTPETFAKIRELHSVLQQHYGDEEIDWLMIYDSGSTTDSMGLPHHISTAEELKGYMESFRQFLLRLPVQPVIITIACSAEDDYCPKDQVAVIQEDVLRILREVYGDRLNPKPILQYLEDEWDVMQL